MGTRTVRLDDDTEQTLARLRRLTGLSISEVLKRGLKAYQDAVFADGGRMPYDVFQELDLGPGGDAAAPARSAKDAVADVIRRKHDR